TQELLNLTEEQKYFNTLKRNKEKYQHKCLEGNKDYILKVLMDSTTNTNKHQDYYTGVLNEVEVELNKIEHCAGISQLRLEKHVKSYLGSGFNFNLYSVEISECTDSKVGFLGFDPRARCVNKVITYGKLEW
ncbi:MAG TPA: hypothetical protein VKR58_08670, partial [Aquella sp.]|nr:hypothetical protein [Aquella sp.]